MFSISSASVHNYLTLAAPLLEAGALNSLIGVLTCRTLMFPELELLMDAAQNSAASPSFSSLVIEENVSGKTSYSTRLKTYRHLRELYVLDNSALLFRVWLQLWAAAPEERRLLALLLAAAREPLLRATAPIILSASPGASLATLEFEAALEEALPGHYRQATRARVARNAASAWTQSGHLTGRTRKQRVRAVTGPATAAFALLLGHLGNSRGGILFETIWARLLDASPEQIDQNAFAAASRGWLDYRRLDNVVDIGFSRWLDTRQPN